MPLTTIKEWFRKPTTLRITVMIAVQTLLALLFDIVGLGVGSIATFLILENANAFVILLYAPLLSTDGGIGVLVSRLGTSLHLGSVKPQLFKNTDYYYTLISAVLTLGVFNSLWIGGISYLINLVASGPNRILNPIPFFVIPILTLTIASLVSSQIGSLLAFSIFKKGLDPDVWVYPTMSTINNLFTTLLYAATIAIVNPLKWTKTKLTVLAYLGIIPVIAYLAFIGVITAKNFKKKDYQKIIREAMPIQMLTLTINSVTGGILSKAESSLKNLPQLFLVYPALIDTLGDECSIMANTTSTNLSLGAIEAKLSAIKDKDLWTNMTGIGIAGLFLHLIYGILGSIIVTDFKGLGIALVISLLINIIGFLIVQVVIFLLMILSFRKGLDPGNFAIPIVASLVNLISATLILFFTFTFKI